MGQPYAGDISSKEAWQVLQEQPDAVLIDVRTQPEWQYVGLPDLSQLNRATVCTEWQSYPDMTLDPDFTDRVRAAGVQEDTTVLLLCRSGARSRNAAIALTSAGFQRCFNIADGFEGPLDNDGHRGTQTGWKAAGLPWRQR